VLENAFEGTPEHLYRLMTAIDSECFRVAFDVGHANVYSRMTPAEWVRALGRYIYCVHLHDNDGEWDRHLGLGQGTVDFVGLFGALKEMNIAPVLAIEVDRKEDIPVAFEFLENLEV